MLQSEKGDCDLKQWPDWVCCCSNSIYLYGPWLQSSYRGSSALRRGAVNESYTLQLSGSKAGAAKGLRPRMCSGFSPNLWWDGVNGKAMERSMEAFFLMELMPEDGVRGVDRLHSWKSTSALCMHGVPTSVWPLNNASQLRKKLLINKPAQFKPVLFKGNHISKGGRID